MTDEQTGAEKNSASTAPVALENAPPPVVGRMADRGPRYTETPADPFAPGAPTPAEPWNTVTASFFIFIAVAWLIRIRGRYAQFPVIVCCMPILLAGGIGGTLYHAYRTRFVYFLLDVVPIQLLGLAAAVYLIIRLGRADGVKKVAIVSIGILVAFVLVNGLFFRNPALARQYPNLPINLSYASLAALILIPIAVVLVRTRFRHGSWVATALASFGIAWFCRLVDLMAPETVPSLTMGTHWLWHTFGAISTAALIEYFYRIEGRSFAELELKLPGAL